MCVLSCSAEFMVGPDMPAIQNIVPEQHIGGFTSWLIEQVKHGGDQSCSDPGHDFKVKLQNNYWYNCSIEFLIPHIKSGDLQNCGLESSVKVKFHPLICLEEGSMALQHRSPSSLFCSTVSLPSVGRVSL